MRMSPNPFVSNNNFSAWQKFQIALLTLTIFPLRALLATICLALAYFVAAVVLFHRRVDLEVPLQGWRRRGKEFVAFVMVCIQVILGIFPVKIKGRQAAPWEAPILVVAPHSSFFDALPYCLLNAPSFIGKSSLINMPIFGKLISLTTPILVDRDMKKSRKMTALKLKERAWKVYSQAAKGSTSVLSQIIIFPEGTCTNRTQIIHYKAGAFAARLPIQPVCLRWPESAAYTAWTWEGPGMLKILWLTAAHLYTPLEIEFLPVYVPNDFEKEDALLFARNVQLLMARSLGIPTSEYSVEDACYLTSTHSTKNADFWNLVSRLKIPVQQSVGMSEFLASWERLRTSSWLRCNYTVNFGDFARFLNHAPDDDVHRLFNMFDWQCCGQVDLREFLIMLYSHHKTLQFFKACCKMFTENGKPLQESDFVKIVRLPYQFSVGKCKRIYSFGLAKSISRADNSNGNSVRQNLCNSIVKRVKIIRDSPAAVISRFRCVEVQ